MAVHEPSLSVGTNSCFKLMKSMAVPTSSALTAPTTPQRVFQAMPSSGAYADLAKRMKRLSFSRMLPVSSSEHSAGISVSDSTKAPPRASMTVMAMGWNIFPSIPVSARIGRYTSVMISTPKNIGLPTCSPASCTAARRSFAVSLRPNSCCFSPSTRTMFSTITTAPSMIRPKSTAPSDMRFPDTPPKVMPIRANKNDRGMAKATIKAARQLPSKNSNTATTRIAPSKRLCSTVAIVRSTTSLRAY